MASTPRIVVTGMGAITPIGIGVPAYWQSLLQGANGCAPITLFDSTHFRTKFACEVKGYDPLDHFDRKDARKLDRFTQFGIVAAREAIEQAGLQAEDVDKTRVGVVLGSGIGGMDTLSREMEDLLHPSNHDYNTEDAPKKPRFNPFFIPKLIIDILTGHVSMRYGFQGPNYGVVSACATGTNSIADAYMLLKSGMADAMVAGGSEAAVIVLGVGGFNAMKALSERNDDPATASRPFDADRDGFVLGEGAGVMTLETLEHAQKRDAPILAELTGVGLSGDAHHITAPHPEGEGIYRMVKMALEMGETAPEEVDYVNLHGTSTPLGDKAETLAMKRIFGDHAYKLNLNSTKSMIGHLLGAAGSVEAIAAIQSIRHNQVHPTINHFTDDPDCDLNYTFLQAQQRTVETALSTNYGFGGHNACLLFRQYTD